MANFATSITFGILKVTAFRVVIAAATIALNFAPLVNFNISFVERRIPFLRVSLLYLCSILIRGLQSRKPGRLLALALISAQLVTDAVF